jgi:hypothetical protein
MKTADVTFQNLDSAEISLTDVSHYFDSDPTKLIQGSAGRRQGSLELHRRHHHRQCPGPLLE